MTSILGGIKTRDGLFYHCLSALPIKPLTRSNYGTFTSLTPRCLYLLPRLVCIWKIRISDTLHMPGEEMRWPELSSF